MTKDKWINIRCTEQERQDITEQAKERNMSVAEVLRYLVAKERKEREKCSFIGLSLQTVSDVAWQECQSRS